jgi:hypothetical protein
VIKVITFLQVTESAKVFEVVPRVEFAIVVALVEDVVVVIVVVVVVVVVGADVVAFVVEKIVGV